MANNKEYTELIDKYRDMVKTRKEYNDINIDDYLPNIYDMLREDCVWDALSKMQESLNGGKDNVNDMAYYVENPPITEPGYYEQDGIFVLRASNFAINSSDWDLGSIDGDTWCFNLNNLDSGGSFTVNNKNFSSYKDYARANNLDCDKLEIRATGIDTAEIPHYTVACTYDNSDIVTMKYQDVKLGTRNGNYAYMPYKINKNGSSDPNKWTITEYDNNDNIKMLKKDNSYYQIMEDMNASKYISSKDSNAKYYVICGAGKSWGSETVKDGYIAQQRAREIMEGNVKDIIVMLDHNIATGRKTTTSKIYYNSFVYADKNIETLIEDLSKSTNGVPLSNLSIAPFGCDKYGRSLGNVWVKIGTPEGDMWINLAKYIQSGTKFTENNPSFSSTDMNEIYGGLSDAFKNYTNMSNAGRYVDALDANGEKSYYNMLALHKELTGLDFTGNARNCTVLLGDTLFMIPPQSIRTSSAVDYEKVPILRGKGAMAKNKTNVEELIELDLYFNSEAGINGIPYETTTPSGKNITYYMNGLRALISQFKIAPFLPIQNHYINDILNIEVVTMVNISANTVEGFPGLLHVVLTLRDFNYRVFMPDLPIPDYTKEENIGLSNMQPIFAKQFDWELFRYYYQRALIHGTELKNKTYNSSEWCEYLYSYKNSLSAADLTDSEMEIYVPDVNWLKKALQIKKSKDKYGQFMNDINLTKEDNSFLTELGNLSDRIAEGKNTKQFREAIDNINKQINNNLKANKNSCKMTNILNAGKTNLIQEVNSFTGTWSPAYSLVKDMLDPIVSNLKNSKIVSNVRVNETTKDKQVIWSINAHLNTASVSDMTLLKTQLQTITGADNTSDILKNNIVEFKITMPLKADGNVLYYAGGISPDLTNEIVNAAYNTRGQGSTTDGTLDTQKVAFDAYNYKEPANMKFVPYLQDEYGEAVPIELETLTFNMSNIFTETHLKSLDGYAPQFMGGSDVTIELTTTITNEYLISALTTLPHTVNDMIRNYRRVMPCYPIRIKNEYLQMIGVNEVLLDNVQVNTKDNIPGVYEVMLRFTSVDRTMRQREALRKTEIENAQTSSLAAQSIGDYFQLQKTLAQAELYPDLDLPTIKELENLGWKFAKWANENRIYVDPDFYICYSFQYAAKIIKEVVNNVMYQVSYNAGIAEANGEKTSKTKSKSDLITQFRMIDQDGIGMDMHAGTDYNGLNVDKQLGYANVYDEVISEIQTNSANDDTKKKSDKQLKDEENLNVLGSAIQYLTASGIEDGWQIAPGWYAPISSKYLEQELEKYKYSGIEQESKPNEKNNKFVEEIYDIRSKALTYIDNILDKPLQCTGDATLNSQDTRNVDLAVNTIFGSSDGQSLLELLCPMRDDGTSSDLTLKPSYFEEANPLNWIKGMLYALACVRSGEETYGNGKENWKPRQWQDNKIPYNKIEGTKAAGDAILAQTEESWKEDGISFGCGQITRYPRSRIKNMLQPKSKIKYFNKGNKADYKNNLYYKTKKAKRSRFCETGFIDPYYNFAGYKSAEGKDYIERISNYQSCNFEALLREVLVHLKRMIMDGYFFGEVDVVSQDWEGCLEDILNVDKIVDNGAAESNLNEGNIISDLFNTTELEQAGEELSKASIFNLKEAFEEYEKKEQEIILGETAYDPELISQLREEIPKTYAKLFCARLIYPFISAATNCNKNVYKLFDNRDYQTLNTFTLASTVGCETNSSLNKFLNAMYGEGMIGSSNAMDSEELTSNTQKAFNLLMSEAFTALANDPRCYVLHSMYDMCVTDKRGRLLRAFPCYYILFVDEGRTIGTWKLYDNFYNMSSVSDIQVVKSRKIPADTCTFTMSNMFMSYTDTYDNSIYQQYVDVYSFKDVFSSVFSPKSYVEKEDMIRRRKQLMDTTPISPGVRIHVRMGYGSDGSKLPIVFNGKIAEVECGEVVQVVAQGDGHELNNPLNTLGELTARNFEESQSWCTLFKDIRGSLARGGETPRNLLAKISTAQYGGAFKTVVREYSKGRFFYDNPFGLYHFGDKRFKDIFEDSEIVQNLYEVSDRTILNGVNDLVGDISTMKSAPVINCTIQDKTLWEIGHLCANSGDDYYFSVRDFGLRSTMCLCRANHYYAYDYQKVNKIDKDNNVTQTDIIAECRKPFQQWHYYDSYNDIIYNAIKATEENMKTNAVGTWEGADWLWGTGQQSVGPIYLDMNIYPEYQKSLTVDTGLVSGGDAGIDIPILKALNEKFVLDEYAGYVNKSLAEKVTTNVLRQSVKDMYTGELCVIGDTSLKPYDRVTFVDTYEDMSGDVEVETVIHAMNMETGFTTTFIPDLIVRTENSAQECGTQSMLAPMITALFGSITMRAAVLSSAKKASGALIKIGATEAVEGGIIQTFISNVTKSALTSGGTLKSGSELLAACFNPVGLAATGIAAASIFMLAANTKEMFTRWCRNIQALTVFPIQKNNRLLIAGMAGHRGSVYGFSYSENGTNPKDSIQSLVMSFLNGSTDYKAANIVGTVFGKFLSDECYEITTNKWMNNLGLTNSNDIINEKASSIRNEEAFRQSLLGAISNEYSSRNTAIASMKTKPRITTFNTSDRTSSIYLKYQIGGIGDKGKTGDNETYVDVKDLPNNERIKGLLAVEDEADVKMAKIEGCHPVVKQIKFAHAKSPNTFVLKMEHENTEIRYIIDKSNGVNIFDLPMLQEDAIIILKLIMNEEALRKKTLTFLSGTRVNSTSSWKSTGFAFSLSCDDMTALETAVKNVKKDSSWISNKQNNSSFAYKNNGKSIEITVYAPIVQDTKTIFQAVEEESDE